MESTKREIKTRKGKIQNIVCDSDNTPVIPITKKIKSLKNDKLPDFLFASAILPESFSVLKSNPFMPKDSTTDLP